MTVRCQAEPFEGFILHGSWRVAAQHVRYNLICLRNLHKEKPTAILRLNTLMNNTSRLFAAMVLQWASISTASGNNAPMIKQLKCAPPYRSVGARRNRRYIAVPCLPTDRCSLAHTSEILLHFVPIITVPTPGWLQSFCEALIFRLLYISAKEY